MYHTGRDKKDIVSSSSKYGPPVDFGIVSSISVVVDLFKLTFNHYHLMFNKPINNLVMNHYISIEFTVFYWLKLYDVDVWPLTTNSHKQSNISCLLSSLVIYCYKPGIYIYILRKMYILFVLVCVNELNDRY